MNKLEQLKQVTTVVADTGDINTIAQYKPQDATTNPSLLLKAAAIEAYQPLIDDAVNWAISQSTVTEAQVDLAAEKLMINFGLEILKIIPGRVSTEVDANLSFNTDATIAAAERIIALYADHGIGTDRILIKIASTWEGIMAARTLEQRGIHCNLTLMFGFEQAIQCADAGVTLISPFVGRIYDWYVKHDGRDYSGDEDPGVQSVKRIYNYYKSNHFDTIIMGASFRNLGQIESLAGCDYLTISPALMGKLQASDDKVSQRLDRATVTPIDKVTFDESTFRLSHNQDAMANEKLAEGIRLFSRDLALLKDLLSVAIQSKHT